MIQKTFLSYKPIMQYIPKTLYGLTKYHHFIKYIAENGNYICVVDGKICIINYGLKFGGKILPHYLKP